VIRFRTPALCLVALLCGASINPACADDSWRGAGVLAGG
jgi:hypothetical protein